MSGQRWIPATTVLLAGFVAGAMAIRSAGIPARAADAPRPASPDDVAALKVEVARLKETATDQSHVMADVGYHFTNLWFAGDAGNLEFGGGR